MKKKFYSCVPNKQGLILSVLENEVLHFFYHNEISQISS